MSIEQTHNRLSKILPDFGVCDFAAIEPYLLPCRAASRLPVGAQSVITAVFPYLLPEEQYANRNVARFAAVPDYHKIVLARLERACEILSLEYPGEAFVPFADNSPLPEKRAALLSGLGVIGQNALFIHPRWGSWVFLGCIVTTMHNAKCTVRKYGGNLTGTIKCSHCGKCEAACPTKAISGGKVDKGKCLSFLSQRKDANREVLARLSGVLWGCDICQEVCPMNAGVPAEPLEEFAAGAMPVWDPAARERVWAWRFGG